MPKKTERLHVIQFSSQFSDADRDRTADLEFVFSKDPDIVSFTEYSSSESKAQLQRTCRANGYIPVMVRGDCQFAVKKAKYIQVKNKSFIPVHPGEAGQYSNKGVAWVKFTFYDQKMYLHAGHWVTRAQDGGIRKTRHVMMSKAMGRAVEKHAHEDAISMFSGDMNADPDQGKYPTEIFREYDLKTCWQDAGVQVKTHTWSTLDVIGRYAGDRNLEFVRFKTWPYQNSDHRPFSVWYDVDVTKKNNNGGNNAGNGGGKDTKPKGKDFVTAGNRSWKDYKDKTIYDLPYAVDDSDTYNG